MYDSELFAKARLFIYRNARALDLARWRFHFEGADKSEVLAALSAYQNKDGGFGWGLEADAWINSYSCKPSHFHRASQRLFTPLLQDLGHKECTQIKQTQCADGSWAPAWAWADYPEQWAVAKLWRKSDSIIRNHLFLRSMHAL